MALSFGSPLDRKEAMSQGERRLAAIMFTDIVGYTSLSQQNESVALELLERHRQLLRPLFSKHAGQEIKTMGDAFLVEFASALEATLCAIDIQSTVHSRNLERAEKLQVRIGIHVGDVMHQGGDVLGDAVNVASRIEPLAAPGGICISEQVQDHIKNKISYPLIKLEVGELKNLRERIAVYKVVLPWEKKETEWEVAPQLDRRRVAVLPFANMSPDPNDEYFADGITEEMIASLSGIRGLTVIARTSMMAYKNAQKRISEIGEELKAGSVIEGSVRKAGERVRVTVQLIDARNEGHDWVRNYDRSLEDIFAIQSEVANDVAESLEVRLMENEKRDIGRAPTRSTHAYDKYLLAKYTMSNLWMSSETPLQTIRYFEEAIEADPTFAVAYASLAELYLALSGDFMDHTEAFSKAEACVKKAMELDDHLAEVWTSRGNLEMQYEWNWEAAERSFKRAIELNPSYSHTYGWYCALLFILGRFGEAAAICQKARELDPLPVYPRGFLCGIYALAGHPDDAIRECDELRRLHATDPEVHNAIALAYAEMGKLEEARQELEALENALDRRRAEGVPGWTSGVVATWVYVLNAFVYAATGEPDRIVKILARALEEAKRSYVSKGNLGILYMALGNKEEGFDLLGKALGERDPSPLFAARWRGLDPFRSDPRFQDLMRRAGLK